MDLIMFPMFFVLISCDIFIDNHQYPRNGAKKPWKVRNFSQITTKIQTTMAVQRSYISSTWPHRRILCGRSHRRNRCRGWNPCTLRFWLPIPFLLVLNNNPPLVQNPTKSRIQIVQYLCIRIIYFSTWI